MKTLLAPLLALTLSGCAQVASTQRYDSELDAHYRNERKTRIEISGVVVDAAGNPVPEVRMTIKTRRPKRSSPDLWEKKTKVVELDDDARFSFRCRGCFLPEIRFSARGHFS